MEEDNSQMAEMAEILFSRRDAEGAEFYSNTDWTDLTELQFFV